MQTYRVNFRGDIELCNCYMSSWEEDFPSYSYEGRDILVKEYESAVQTVDSEERLFANAANLSAAVAAGFGSVAIGFSGGDLGSGLPFEHAEALALLAIVTPVVIYSFATLSYFTGRRKSITYAKRKIVVLRRMLGLSYGSPQLALPSDRLEATDMPFSIRVFPGWLSYVTYPFWIVVAFSSVIFWFVGGRLLAATDMGSSIPGTEAQFLLIAIGIWIFLAALFFRYGLYDTHGNFWLSLAEGSARFLRLQLIGNPESAVYRAHRAVAEHDRQNIDLSKFYDILVFVEDRRFESHPGVSLRALVRVLLGYMGYRRRSGGSTITQQLARTLLVIDFKKTVRRKLIEFPLAFWAESAFEKDKILDLYLVSVRYAYGVNGTLAALKHYFGDIDTEITKAHVFFLVERVSNIRDQILAPKIDDTLRQTVKHNVIERDTARQVVGIYCDMIESGKLWPQDPESFQRLVANWG